jgi:hypothetical protein
MSEFGFFNDTPAVLKIQTASLTEFHPACAAIEESQADITFKICNPTRYG